MLPDETETSWAAILFGAGWASAWLLCLGTGLHAINWFMAMTAMPSAAVELDAVPLISWATTVFLVFSIIGGASGGLLKIRHGARRLLSICTLVFLAGTLVAALAPGMTVLLVGRALQGVAEGVILAVSYALVRELFPPRAIPQAFALLAMVYAVCAALGPLAAGILTEWAGWRWAFLPNLPLALAYLGLLHRGLAQRTSAAETPAGPVAGLRLSLIGIAALCICLAGLAERGAAIVAGLLAGLACCAGLLALDRRSAEPLFPRGAFTLATPIALGLWVALLLPAASAGVQVYVPYLIQVIGGGSAMVAGYLGALTAIGWSTAAILVARLPQRHAGAALVAGPMLVTAAVLATGWLLARHAGTLPLGCCLLLVGMGFGGCWAFLTQRTQAAVPLAEQDLAAGAIPTLQSAGGTLGAAMAGLLANAGGLREAQAGAAAAEAAAQAAWWIFLGGGAIAALATAASAVLVARTRHAGLD